MFSGGGIAAQVCWDHADNAAGSLRGLPMTGLFIIAHAPLASALQAAAAHAYPESAGDVAFYDVPPGDAFASYELAAGAALAALPAEQGVLILTDILGATPANLAAVLARRGRHRALAGVNVPMLWRALNYRHLPLDEVFTRASEGGARGVQPILTPPPQNQASPPVAHDQNHSHHQQ